LVEALEAGALALGYATDLLTLARGAKLIAKISSKRYSESGVLAAHQEIELFLPAAERSREANAAAILHWKKKRRPTLKNGAREGRTIVFIDESGVRERPRRVRTFAPKGKTPVRQESFPWNQLSAIAGVTFWNISFKLVKGGVRAPVLRQAQERRLSQKSPPPSRPPQAPHHLGLRADPLQPRRAE
jgi:hypothetical protein